jgi:peptidoglycan/xylan/chitin deacetylase (PgdA/CDA1 family)
MLSINPIAYAVEKQVAITIDDLPFVGSANYNPGNLRREHDRFMKMLAAIKDRGVPATGFVVAGTIEKGQWDMLNEFANAGLEVGNHTYSHPNLYSTATERYIKDIDKADKVLKPILTKPKFFRYPYLAEGRGEKKEKVLSFLHQKGYIIAPVTIDSKDFRFNDRLFSINWRNRPQHLPKIKQQYLSYIWQQTKRAERISEKNGKPIKEILLIHANLINAHAMGDIIDMYQKKGYKIVPLRDILLPSSIAKMPIASE